MSDVVGHGRTDQELSVGHDPDLPPRDDRHTLSTYEAARMFEEAECRVSERTIIRWCNKNKRGHRRLDCAFEPDERKYYIDASSVKRVIREERSKGRQSDLFNPDLSDIEEVADIPEPHRIDADRQGRTESDTNVGQPAKPSDTVGHKESTQSDDVGHGMGNMTDSAQHRGAEHQAIADENTKLKIDLARMEEQARTKDEMMTFLRKEIDRRGEQIAKDREIYESTLGWFRGQIEAKDGLIDRLNTEVRGLLEAPKRTGEQFAHSTQESVSDVDVGQASGDEPKSW